MAIISNTVNYLDDELLLEGFFAYDNTIKGIRPTVLICHAWGGRDDFVCDKAEKLAKMGYFAFAVDMYGQGILGKSTEENAQLMQPLMEARERLQQRMQAALRAVTHTPWADEKNIAAIGFCFGGLCVLDLARTGADIKGVVSFHGLLLAPDNLKQQPIKAKVLVLHGHDDPMISPELLSSLQQELTEKGADWQLHSYSHTSHAFTNPNANDPDFGTVYQPNSDRRSWVAMQNFLSEIFA
ncbi:MAG: dienelactone hydrolase family protein [Methylococcales bacterium]|nr:dienelactone hydrolase family protein [Methylococcales bacterium]